MTQNHNNQPPLQEEMPPQSSGADSKATEENRVHSDNADNLTSGNQTAENRSAEHQATENNASASNQKQRPSLIDQVAQGIDALGNMFEQFAKQFETESLTLDELIQKLSPSVDQDMIKTAKAQNLTALGGELYLIKEDARMGHFKVDIKLYFIDQQKNYILREKTISPQLLVLTKEAKADLLQNAPIKYPIAAPKA